MTVRCTNTTTAVLRDSTMHGGQSGGRGVPFHQAK
jgi:hypothetical protein